MYVYICCINDIHVHIIWPKYGGWVDADCMLEGYAPTDTVSKMTCLQALIGILKEGTSA